MSTHRGRQVNRGLLSLSFLLVLVSAADDLEPTLPDYLGQARQAVERQDWTQAVALLERAAWAQGALFAWCLATSPSSKRSTACAESCCGSE